MDTETKKYFDQKFEATTAELAAIKKVLFDLDSRLSADVIDLGEAMSAVVSHLDERFDELTPVKRDVGLHEKRITFLEERLPRLAVDGTGLV